MIRFGEIPTGFSRPERQIVRVFVELRRDHTTLGSGMFRLIAQRLDYEIDKNGSNEYIRRTVNKYFTALRESAIQLPV